MKSKLYVVLCLVMIACTPQPPADIPGRETITDDPDGEPPLPLAGIPVTMSSLAFDPQEIRIGVGQSVVWTNEDDEMHTVTGDAFDSGNIIKGESFAYTFTEKGRFEYVCTLYPSMSGVVEVD